MGKILTRRSFIQSTAIAGVAAHCGFPAILRAASPNSKLRHACIGVGGMGLTDLKNFLSNPLVEIAAICDVGKIPLESALQEIAKQNRPKPAVYADWRELLATEDSKIDSVNITVPDHMHAIITLAFLKARKHVYCQKPLCHDVAEVRAVMAAAKQAGVRTQLGTQGASGLNQRTVIHMIQEGVIGKIRRIVGYDGEKANWLAGPRPAQGQQPPNTLNWDLWIGTAPMRPYAPNIYHPGAWRSWLDFGTGCAGDLCCHRFHVAWKSLGLGCPISIEANPQQSWVDSPLRRADTWPQSNRIKWILPETKLTAGPVTYEWYDGEFSPDDETKRIAGMDKFLQLYIGTDGAIVNRGDGGQLLPSDKFKSYQRPKLAPADHYADFVSACFTGQATISDFDLGGKTTEAVLLGMVATRVPGAKLDYDAAQMKFPGHPEAERFLRREYRDGWKIGEICCDSVNAPQIANKSFTISCIVETDQKDAIILAHGGSVIGYALHLKNGRVCFAVRTATDKVTEISSGELKGATRIVASLAADNTMKLTVGDQPAATGKAPGLISHQPQEDFCLGHDNKVPVATYTAKAPFKGSISGLTIHAE
ncbi:MAG: Gfo/Idh/MocA family oxidoreductase [Candidatus Sumerlaeota bacterium]|nr:Gfo/Idh/MocA family oxidoreductase [Candidatus Sumerlaeota bacterium]